MKVTFEDEVSGTQQGTSPAFDPPPPPPLPQESGTQMPEPPDPPPPYEEAASEEPKHIPVFGEDPMLHLLDMKVPTAEIGFCACSLRTTNFAIVFYISSYALMLVADAFGVIPDIIRTVYSFRFQLLLTKENQFYINGWLGAFLLISAFALCWATVTYNHTGLMAWMAVMSLFVLMTFTTWLLGLLLSLSSDGWNGAATQAISVGTIQLALEIYLLHMVYSYNRYMHDLPDVSYLYDPRLIAQREYELAQLGYQEINVMGVMLTTPLPRAANPAPPPAEGQEAQDPVTTRGHSDSILLSLCTGCCRGTAH